MTVPSPRAVRAWVSSCIQVDHPPYNPAMLVHNHYASSLTHEASLQDLANIRQQILHIKNGEQASKDLFRVNLVSYSL